MDALWTSVLMGGGLGVAYGAVAHVMGRWALRHERHRFLARAVGGMLARMVGMLAATAAAVAFAPVRPAPFAAALVPALLAGLAAEIVTLHRRTGDRRAST